MFKQVLLPILGVIIFISIVGYFTQKPSLFSPVQKNVTIDGKVIQVSIADTPDKRTKGLGGISSLDQNSGMLFIFDSKQVSPLFWMKDMLIALDIIWIDSGKVIQIDKNVPPPEVGTPDNKLKVYSAGQAVNYVLEVNAGFSDQNNIKVGDDVTIL